MQSFALLAATLTVAAQAMKVTITKYGAGDTFGSPNCNTATASCGFYNNPGFNAAASQNIFGAASGKGSGCSQCWKLSAGGNGPIVVKINNLCPPAGNPLCNQTKPGDKNSHGAEGHFDLCMDDGAAKAFFGSGDGGLATGTAEKVDCGQWKGSADKKS